MRKKMIVTLLFTVLTASGCATIQQTADTVSSKTGMNKAGGEATVGAGIGAAAGALVGKVTGLGTGTGALIGGLFGAGIGYAEGHERDVKDAEALAEELRQEADLKPVVTLMKAEAEPEESASATKTEPVAAKTEPQKALKVAKTIEPTAKKEATKKELYKFRDLRYEIPAASLAAHTEVLQSTFEKTGKFATTRKHMCVIFVDGVSKKDADWIKANLEKGFVTGMPVPTVVYTPGPLLDEHNKVLPPAIKVQMTDIKVPNGMA